MKTRNIIIIAAIVVVLAGLIVGALAAYKKLSKKISTDNVIEYQTPAPATTEAASEESTEQQSGGAKSSDFRDFTMQDADGKDVKLSDLADKPIVLNFWASWCPPCRAEMPDFEEMYKQYGDKVNFVFVNLTDGSRETKKSADDFIKEQGFTFPVYYDVYGEASGQYNLYYIPDTFFFDSSGNLAGAAVGGIDRATMEENIGKLAE